MRRSAAGDLVLTKQQARAVAHLATLLREDWDEAGLMAQLGKVIDRPAADVAMAMIRFCADEKVRTPGAFANPNGPHWVERITPADNVRRPPKLHEECPEHPGEYHLSCRLHAADRKAQRDELDQQAEERARLSRDEALTAMRGQVAEARQQTAARTATQREKATT